MTDDIIIPLGAQDGPTLATDEIASKHYPRNKIIIGADGVNDGDVSAANPLPVDLGTNNDVTLATLPDTAAGDLAAINAALAGTLTVDLGANNDVTVTSGAVTATLAAETTKVIGTVNIAAGQSITVDMGANNDVTMATLPDTAASDLAAINAALAGTLTVTGGGGGTEYTEDVATPAAIVGTATLMERDDALSAVTPAEGDWIGLRGDANGALWTTINGTVTVDGSASTQPVSAVSLPLPTGASTEATLSTASTTLTTISGNITACNTGAVVISSGTVTANLGATDNAVLDSIDAAVNGTLTVGSHAVTNAGTFAVQVPSTATGGATPGKLISAATTNATSVKASAGTLYSLQVFNTNAAARYLKLYNKASAPTVGTDVPVQVFTIPGNTAGAGLVVPIPTSGIAFSTGIAFATTTGAADSDTAAVAANEIVVSYSYK